MTKKGTYRITSAEGIDEKIYVDINGQKQYVFLRGKDIHNPVILYLHGGPGSPDSYFTYDFAREICGEFTFVCWDQRGCGRTYIKNRKIDSKNKTVNFEQAIEDTDALVSYLRRRFQKDRIIIIGHSYGTVLGVNYVLKHPEKVESYIGIGQHVSNKEAQERNYNEIIQKMSGDSKKRDIIESAYQKLKDNYDLENFMRFQQKAMPCLHSNLPEIKQKSQWKLLVESPDFSYADLRWLIGMLNVKGYFRKHKELLNYMFFQDVRDAGIHFSVPIFLISGEYDKVCRVDLTEEYFETIQAPDKKLVLIKLCGHSPQMDDPATVAKEIKDLLAAE